MAFTYECRECPFVYVGTAGVDTSWSIPEGTYTSGTIRLVSNGTLNQTINTRTLPSGVSTQYVFGPLPVSSDRSLALIPATIQDINALAGQVLRGRLAGTAGTRTISNYQLIVDGEQGSIVIPAQIMPDAIIRNIMQTSTLPPIYINRTFTSLQNFPVGYQISLDYGANWFLFSPGLFNYNAAKGNSQTGVRIYKGSFSAPNDWNFTQPKGLPVPFHTQTCDTPAIVPLGGLLDLYIEFYSYNASIPANSTLEFCVLPFNER